MISVFCVWLSHACSYAVWQDHNTFCEYNYVTVSSILNLCSWFTKESYIGFILIKQKIYKKN